MRLTTKTRYGMRAVAELAMRTRHGPVSVSTIAAKQGISVHYLEQLLNKLKKSGIVKSVRGPRGGYVLAKDPGRIKVYDIVKVLEGDISIVLCVSDKKPKKECDRINECITRFIWYKLNEAITATLKSVTLKDLCSKFAKEKGASALKHSFNYSI